MTEPEPVFTPTEDLILEVLAARTRLGHGWWHIADNRTTRHAAKHLTERGYIRTMHATVPKHFRATLTVKGRREYLDPTYTPPIQGGPL